MVAPAVAAAGIGAVGSVVGGVLGGKGAKKAAKLQLQATRESNALQQKIYDQNTSNLTPFMDRGNAAGSTMNALLGIAEPDYASYVMSNPDLIDAYRKDPTQWNGLDDFGKFHYNRYGQMEGRALPNGSTDAAGKAFDTFRDSTGYQFRMDQGMNALNTGLASAGKLQSGAAMKSALKYGQGIASDEFARYMGYLGNQQGVGLSGANALTGVGTNYANAISNNNQANATTAGNAALVQASMMGQGIAGAANAIGNALGSSYSNTPRMPNSGGNGGGIWINPDAIPQFGR